MRLRQLQFLVYILLVIQVPAQKTLINFLANQKGSFELYLLNKETKLVPTPIGLTCADSRHDYFVNDGRLYLQINGTGKLFTIDSSLAVTRLDNTCYEGYNYGSYSYIRNNKIYNLGGWGFWQFNSGLRYFDTTSKEWFREPINKEVQLAKHMNALFYPDQKNDLLYAIYQSYPNSYYKLDNDIKNDTVYMQCLNLKTNDWWNAPKILNDKIFQETVIGTSAMILPGLGILTESYNHLYLINPATQKLYEIENEIGGTIMNYVASKNTLYFYKDEKLHIYNPQLDSLVSLPLSMSKFSEVAKPLYKKISPTFIETIDIYKLLFSSAIVLLLIIVVVLFIKNKRLYKMQQTAAAGGFQKKSIEVNKQLEFSDNLTETEKSVLDILVEYSKQGAPTSIDQINRALGVKNKEVTIQNKLRSDTLQMINKKFMVFASTNDTLVEREKTALDKRVYQYKLNERYLNKIK
ncbi:MAG: hypothetical protein RL372_66 [Bacteroidota bacterium]|jgi:hypothetical protein